MYVIYLWCAFDVHLVHKRQLLVTPVACFVFANLFLFDLVSFPYQAKRLAGKNVAKRTCFVWSGTHNLPQSSAMFSAGGVWLVHRDQPNSLR